RHGAMRILLIDSCAYHGVKGEHNHGRISDATLGEIDRRLSADGPCALNLLVCHHHPQKLAEYKLGDYDDMVNGQKLLDLLGYGKHGDWVVLHGHKHCPKVSYAAGGATSPLVFSCGSVGARLFAELVRVHEINGTYWSFRPVYFRNLGLSVRLPLGIGFRVMVA